MVGLSVGLGIASGLTSFMGGLSADKAQAAAIDALREGVMLRKEGILVCLQRV